MINLLIKDFLVQKKTLAIAILYIISMLIFLQGFNNNGAVFLAGIPTVAYLFWVTAFQSDEKNKSEQIISSLPVTRREIVIAKYLSTIFYLVIGIIILLLVVVVVKTLGIQASIPLISIENIYKSVLSMLILASVNFPPIFKYGLKRGKIYNVITYMAFFFMMINLKNILLKSQNLQQYIQNRQMLVTYVVTLVTVLILIISVTLSIKIYENKDF